MKAAAKTVACGTRARSRAAMHRVLLAGALMQSGQALASGSMEDRIADAMVWVVIVIAPIVAVTLFWVVHVWPERVAHARNHPQKDAIQALCLLSLVFGGLLWPLAMLWAYMKPLRFRLEGEGAGDEPAAPPAHAPSDPHFDGTGAAPHRTPLTKDWSCSATVSRCCRGAWMPSSSAASRTCATDRAVALPCPARPRGSASRTPHRR